MLNKPKVFLQILFKKQEGLEAQGNPESNEREKDSQLQSFSSSIASWAVGTRS